MGGLIDTNPRGPCVQISPVLEQISEEMKDVTIAKSEYRPQFGFAARFTKYDLDDNLGDEDVRGGLYFSYPFFDFGRSSAKISGSKAKSRAAVCCGQSVPRQSTRLGVPPQSRQALL